MSDLIDRQAAIDGKISIQRANGVEIYSDEAVPVEYLKALPSAQPDLTDEDRRLIKKMRSFHNGSYARVLDKLMAFASAQPERKRGKWLDNNEMLTCSVCGKWIDVLQGSAEMNYCPHCGADMRGDSDEA